MFYRWLLALVLIIAAAPVVACGGNDSSDDGSAREPASSRSDDERAGDDGGDVADVSDDDAGAGDVDIDDLFRRATEAGANVDSVEATMELGLDFGGFAISVDAEMAMEPPDRMYMTMSMFGEEIEMLMLLPDIYMYMQGEWYEVDAATAGFDPEQFRRIFENQGFLDLDAMRDAMTLTDLGVDEIGGVEYRRLGATVDPARMLDAVSEGFFGEEAFQDLAADAIESIDMEMWIDEETALTRRVEVTMVMEIPEAGTGEMTMRMDFESYNEPVDIPAPPADVRPISELNAPEF